jgi:cytochrome c peroxidase
MRAAARVVVPLALLACEPEATLPFSLPAALPVPNIPEGSWPTAENIELGRHLFYEPSLSLNGTMACASCHVQALAFADGLIKPTGATGDLVARNSMSLANAAWWSTYTWMNPVLTTLEQQALVPLTADAPLELGVHHVHDAVFAAFRADPVWAARWEAAFPHDKDPYDLAHLVIAISNFERSLISADSAWDRYAYGGDANALTAQQKTGANLFFSERTECYHCHSGPLFSTAFASQDQPVSEPSFLNTGLYNLEGDDGPGAYPAESPGLVAFTGDPADQGRFRAPTLRNVAVTAPYFHDGSAATLDDVLAHYRAGGRTISEGPYAGVGADNPYKNPLVHPLDLTDEEVAALKSFLLALTDETFLTNPDYGDPTPETPTPGVPEPQTP